MYINLHFYLDYELFVWLCSKLNYLWLDQTFDWQQKSIDKFLVPEPESGTQWVNCQMMSNLSVFICLLFLIFPTFYITINSAPHHSSDILDNIVLLIIIALL